MICGPELSIKMIQQWHFQLLRFPAQLKSAPMTWFHCWNCSAPGPLISPSLFSNPFFENPWRVQPFFTLTDWVLVSSNRIQFLTPPVLLNRNKFYRGFGCIWLFLISYREGAGSEISGRPDWKKNATLARTTDAEPDCAFVKDAHF